MLSVNGVVSCLRTLPELHLTTSAVQHCLGSLCHGYSLERNHRVTSICYYLIRFFSDA